MICARCRLLPASVNRDSGTCCQTAAVLSTNPRTWWRRLQGPTSRRWPTASERASRESCTRRRCRCAWANAREPRRALFNLRIAQTGRQAQRKPPAATSREQRYQVRKEKPSCPQTLLSEIGPHARVSTAAMRRSNQSRAQRPSCSNSFFIPTHLFNSTIWHDLQMGFPINYSSGYIFFCAGPSWGDRAQVGRLLPSSRCVGQVALGDAGREAARPPPDAAGGGDYAAAGRVGRFPKASRPGQRAGPRTHSRAHRYSCCSSACSSVLMYKPALLQSLSNIGVFGYGLAASVGHAARQPDNITEHVPTPSA